MEPRRGAGRPSRNGSSPSKDAEPAAAPVRTATEVLEQLEAMRHANVGYVIPPPATLASARLVEPPDSTLGDRLGVPNKAMQEATAWLMAIAQTGSPEDLTLAWETWRLPGGLPPTVNPKLNLLSMLEQLKVSCGVRWSALYQQAERERHNERAAAALRSQLRDERAAAETILRDYEKAAAKADRTAMLLAETERRGRLGSVLQ